MERQQAQDPEWAFDSNGSVSLLVPWRPGGLGLWNTAVDFSSSGWGRREGVGVLAFAPNLVNLWRTQWTQW